MNFYSQLNEAQLKAVKHKDGPMMVLAGPGSGKTFVITRRLFTMINLYHVPPEKILVITFTKAAANEMKERFNSLVGGNCLPVRFGTFHSVFYSFVKSSDNFKNSQLISDIEKKRYLNATVKDTSFKENVRIDDSLIDNILNDISYIKNEGTMPCEFGCDYMDSEEFADIYFRYNRIIHENNYLDFDDMILLCRDMINEKPDFLNKIKGLIEYILIDEFQDINRVQFEIIRKIAYPENNLFIVGDDDQSIYGFRGSKPEIMLEFPSIYNKTEVVNLPFNYRSSSEIVESALSLIEKNKKRYNKKLISSKGAGGSINIKEFESGTEEASFITEYIKKHRDSDTALIFRTNSEAAMITKFLADEKIRFHYKEKNINLFSTPFVAEVFSILKFAHGDNSRENFFRFMNKPPRYLNRDLFRENSINLKKIINDRFVSDRQAEILGKLYYDLENVGKCDLYCGVNYIRKGMGFDEYVMNSFKSDKTKIKEVMDRLNMFEQICEKYGDIYELKKYYEDYENIINWSKNESDKDDDVNVTVITMHGSKGLEYTNVIIPGLNEGYMPSGMAESEDEIEEERRVLYVAMTRAKENLVLSYVKKNKENRLSKSRFLDEINI